MRPRRNAPRAGGVFLAAGLLPLLLSPSGAGAQTCPLAPGCTQTLQQDIPFATTGQSLWGPGGGGSAPVGRDVWLFDSSWSESDAAADRVRVNTIFGDQDFGGEVRGESSGRFGMKFVFENTGSASVSVDFPVRVAVTLPQPNTFRPGEPVTIQTGWTTLSGLDLETEMDGMDLSLQGVFRMRSAAEWEICFFDCSGRQPFFPTVDVPETTFPLLDVTGGQVGIGDEVLELTDEAAVLTNFLTGISLVVKRPAPLGQPTVSGNRITASGSEKFMDLDLDVDAFLQKVMRVIPRSVGKVPLLLEGNLELKDYGFADIRWNTVDLDTGFELTDVESVSFEGSPRVRVDFPMELTYQVSDPSGSVTASGQGASVTLPVGHSLTVFTPSTVVPTPLQPTFSLENTFSREAELRFFGGFTNTELELGFSLARKEFQFSRLEDRWKDVWVSCSKIIDAGNAGEFFSLLGECLSGAIDGTWKSVKETVTAFYDYVARATAVDLGPLYQESFAETDAAMTILDAAWPLEGFGEHAGPTLVLDPEDPRIAVDTWIFDSFLETGMDAGTVTQVVVVQNTGDVPLLAARILDALAADGLSVDNLQSFDLTVDPAFDGDAAPELLAPGQTLPVGATGTVTLRWAAVPGLHRTTVEAHGTSPIGTPVSDAVDVAFGWIPMKVEPERIKRRKEKEKKERKKKKDRDEDHRKIQVELHPSPGIPASAIDPASLTLEGVPPLEHELEHEDGRRILEAKFPLKAVLDSLDARLQGGSVALAPLPGVELRAAPAVAFTPAEVARALLGEASPSAGEIQAMDRAGNGNGRLDVGDLRARLLAEEPGAVRAEGKKEKKERKGKGEKKHEEDDDRKGTPYTLILTGSLADGTPIWAEAVVLIRDSDKGDDR